MSILNNIWNGVKAVGSTLIGSTPIGQARAVVNAESGQPPVSSTPVVNAQTTPPVAPIVNTPKNNVPVLSPIKPTVTTPTVTTPPPTPFKLDTSNITSDHLAGDNTPNSILASVYKNYQDNTPTADQYAQATQFSPGYLDAYNQTLDTNQGYRAGVQNIRGRPEALDFQQGQESALTRDTALTKEANAENMALQEAIRQNNIASVQAKQTGAQNQFSNQMATIQSGLNYGISKGGLDIQQQQATQNRYEYQQITDPTTGFPTIQILDKQTGLPVGNVSPGSPMGQQIQNSGSMITGGTNNGVINGYNITSYATDPNHEQAVSGWYTAINNATSQVGGITDANTAQAVINQLAPNSPVTGNMIIASAQKYGVDPALMISIMQQDSQMGTKGLATKTFNPGNVGNDGTNIKNMGSWDKGVDSVAQWLSTHKDNTQTSSTATYQNVISKAPAQLQSAIRQLPDGTAYIDQGSIPNQSLAIMAQNFASKNGIKMLSSDDAKAMQSANQAIANLKNLSSMFNNLAPNDAVGRAYNTATNWFSKLTDNEYGQQLKSYADNQDGLLQQIRTLSGMSPRLNGVELQITKQSFPQVTGGNKDTITDGANKLTLSAQYLDNAIRAIVPNYVGTPVPIAGKFAVRLSNGKVGYFDTSDMAIKALSMDKPNQ